MNGKKIRIFFDIDGVLADFDFNASKKLTQEELPLAKNLNVETSLLSPCERELKQLRWHRIEEDKHFWITFPALRGVLRLCNAAYNIADKVLILSALPKGENFKGGNAYLKHITKSKKLWVKMNFGRFFRNDRIIVTLNHKDSFVDNRYTDILIDDREKNIEDWEAKGGYGVLFTDSVSAIFELNRIISKLYGIPFFKYHPQIMLDRHSIVCWGKERTCECCGEKVDFYLKKMYSKASVECVCLNCVKSGEAAKKFNGSFIQGGELAEDSEKSEELFGRTPGYVNRAGEHWLTCCGDYAAYMGTVTTEDLEELEIAEEVFEDYSKQNVQIVKPFFKGDSSVTAYLFYCPTCGRYRIWADAD